MVVVLLVVFVVIPMLELYVIVQVGGAIGALATFGLLVLVMVAGALVVKRQGLGILRRAQGQVQQGELPADEMLDGLLVLLAGVLLLAPGFVTDVVGLVLLVPAIRSLARPRLARRFQTSVAGSVTGFGGTGTGYVRTRVYDVRNVGDVTPPQWRTDVAPPVRGELGEG
jgi:UPF0716 protein FxsA